MTEELTRHSYKALLHGRSVLVVEDSYLVAQELTEALMRENAFVLGPVSTLTDGWRLARDKAKLDIAILDVNIRGEMIWPLADFLYRQNVQIVFSTGYATTSIKERFPKAHIVQKPAPARTIVRLLSTPEPSQHGTS